MSKQLVKHVKHRRHHLRRGVVRQIRAQLRVRVPHAGVFCLFALKGRGVLGDGVVGEVSVCVCGAGVVVIADAEAHVRVEEEPRAERLPRSYRSAYVSIRQHTSSTRTSYYFLDSYLPRSYYHPLPDVELAPGYQQRVTCFTSTKVLALRVQKYLREAATQL